MLQPLNSTLNIQHSTLKKMTKTIDFRATAALLLFLLALLLSMPNLLALIILLIIISATMEAIRAMASKWTPTRRICRRSTTESPTLP